MLTHSKRVFLCPPTPKDRDDTARISLQELHIPIGNRKLGSRALFYLCVLPFPHLSWEPQMAAAFEWVVGQIGGRMDGRMDG